MAQPQPQPAQALSLEEQVDQLEYEIQKLARIIRRPDPATVLVELTVAAFNYVMYGKRHEKED
ncbi:hypothetical protein CHLRE_11g476000v5 [Chlamydomonas reinhardtii]|uniref:Uncharacterized protein n=1 Tax=Chlamydomonas reinhardtii TaxID=3055 RepID=A0A2K3D8D4_CHLRE|nr:uncharacterized protein CHLRE_11g476000v5 [Chlamydomonas reinhardtii]PNW76783.1 hypothetical protein CHLRE_11g476000v5 [Chlamydomonas reinhardtii]